MCWKTHSMLASALLFWTARAARLLPFSENPMPTSCATISELGSGPAAGADAGASSSAGRRFASPLGSWARKRSRSRSSGTSTVASSLLTVQFSSMTYRRMWTHRYFGNVLIFVTFTASPFAFVALDKKSGMVSGSANVARQSSNATLYFTGSSAARSATFCRFSSLSRYSATLAAFVARSSGIDSDSVFSTRSMYFDSSDALHVTLSSIRNENSPCGSPSSPAPNLAASAALDR
mmetsp:Transcript_25961/g.64876  ORF Transcript_25961/g.64876 Transcript_25961/m.64876 type:complete len:235 (+) Transcript_25961:1113-1817(+)